MTSKKEKPTFIEEACRKKMIDAALQTIAEQGYSQTSFAEIAKSLGITKGLIAYHFNGKQDLIASVLHNIIENQAAYLRARLAEQATATEKLRVYITSSLEYIEANRPPTGRYPTWLRFGDDAANRQAVTEIIHL